MLRLVPAQEMAARISELIAALHPEPALVSGCSPCVDAKLENDDVHTLAVSLGILAAGSTREAVLLAQLVNPCGVGLIYKLYPSYG